MYLLTNLPKDVYLLGLNVEDAIADGNFPASTAYIDVSGFSSFGYIVLAGALDSELTCQVKQDTSATQTAGIKDVTGATFKVPALGDDKVYSVEVECDRLDSNGGFRYVTLAISGAAGGNDYGAILFYGVPNVKPATQPATTVAPVIIAG